MNAYIKIKMLSLGAEIKLIRHEERKWLKIGRHAKGFAHRYIDHLNSIPNILPEIAEQENHAYNNFWGLHSHRLGLRDSARVACLAYAFVRGRPYAKTEHPNSRKPDLIKVGKLVAKYGEGYAGKDCVTLVEEWYKKSFT